MEGFVKNKSKYMKLVNHREECGHAFNRDSELLQCIKETGAEEVKLFTIKLLNEEGEQYSIRHIFYLKFSGEESISKISRMRDAQLESTYASTPIEYMSSPSNQCNQALIAHAFFKSQSQSKIFTTEYLDSTTEVTPME